jgi:hypothetical protein
LGVPKAFNKPDRLLPSIIRVPEAYYTCNVLLGPAHHEIYT